MIFSHSRWNGKSRATSPLTSTSVTSAFIGISNKSMTSPREVSSQSHLTSGVRLARLKERRERTG